MQLHRSARRGAKLRCDPTGILPLSPLPLCLLPRSILSGMLCAGHSCCPTLRYAANCCSFHPALQPTSQPQLRQRRRRPARQQPKAAAAAAAAAEAEEWVDPVDSMPRWVYYPRQYGGVALSAAACGCTAACYDQQVGRHGGVGLARPDWVDVARAAQHPVWPAVLCQCLGPETTPPLTFPHVRGKRERHSAFALCTAPVLNSITPVQDPLHMRKMQEAALPVLSCSQPNRYSSQLPKNILQDPLRVWKMLGWLGLALVALAVHELRPYRVGWRTRRGCECGEAKPSEVFRWLVGMLPASGARCCTDGAGTLSTPGARVASPNHPLPAGRLNSLCNSPSRCRG